jgi:hypothetical protein
MEPTTLENINIPYVKQAFPQIVPFLLEHRFGTKKLPQTLPKPFQNPFQKTPRENLQNQHQFEQILASK